MNSKIREGYAGVRPVGPYKVLAEGNWIRSGAVEGTLDPSPYPQHSARTGKFPVNEPVNAVARRMLAVPRSLMAIPIDLVRSERGDD